MHIDYRFVHVENCAINYFLSLVTFYPRFGGAWDTYRNVQLAEQITVWLLTTYAVMPPSYKKVHRPHFVENAIDIS